MKRKNKVWAVIFVLFILLTVLFIFAQSLDSRDVSSQKSSTAYKILKPILDIFVGPEKATEHLVRKLAHFCEFGLLGVLTAHLDHQRKSRHLTGAAMFTLLIAMGDETIQIFTGRGSQVQDVWLDFCGACVGLFGMVLLFLLADILFGRKKAKNR